MKYRIRNTNTEYMYGYGIRVWNTDRPAVHGALKGINKEDAKISLSDVYVLIAINSRGSRLLKHLVFSTQRVDCSRLLGLIDLEGLNRTCNVL